MYAAVSTVACLAASYWDGTSLLLYEARSLVSGAATCGALYFALDVAAGLPYPIALSVFAAVRRAGSMA